MPAVIATISTKLTKRRNMSTLLDVQPARARFVAII